MGRGRGRRRMEEKAAGNKKHGRSVQNDRGRLRIVPEVVKPKNLYAQPMDLN